jgi:hypothetical protein
MILINIHDKIGSSRGENYMKYYQRTSPGFILIR